MDSSVTILINSCDKYEDAWEPFFRLLKIQWPECSYDIVLSTETKKYACDFLNVKTINSANRVSWSARLKNVLEQIDTEYILFFLEDFFLLDKVQINIFNKALELIKADKKIGLITFIPKWYSAKFPQTTNYDRCFTELDKKCERRTNVVVGLWRKEYFLKLICEDENPWEYEKNSNIRSKFAGYKIYTQDYKYSFPAFRYCMDPKDGLGITEGKWLCKNKDLFESFGIFNVNYENLGNFEAETSYGEIQRNSRENNEQKREQRKKALKKEKSSVQIKERLYDLYKYIKKTQLMKKIEYYKTCIKYFIYYKTH